MDVINLAVYMLETRMYLLPEEKLMLVLEVLGFGLFLMDSIICWINTSKLERLQNLLSIVFMVFVDLYMIILMFSLSNQNLEVFSLFGDVQIAPFNYIKRSKTYDASRWYLCGVTLPSPQSALMVHLPQICENILSNSLAN